MERLEADLDLELPTVTLHYAAPDDASPWHDGPGWYYVFDDHPDEGSCGAFETEREAREHARAAGCEVSAIL